MSSPPSCTIHHTSMFPPVSRSWLPGKWSMFLATNRAWSADVVSRTVSGRTEGWGSVRPLSEFFKKSPADSFGDVIASHVHPHPVPMKFLLAEESWACFQPAGQAIRTALCFIPPSPADWMSREKPSRRLDDTTTWEKPLVRSAAMAALRFCRNKEEVYNRV